VRAAHRQDDDERDVKRNDGSPPSGSPSTKWARAGVELAKGFAGRVVAAPRELTDRGAGRSIP
jgi:hypothetical protein